MSDFSDYFMQGLTGNPMLQEIMQAPAALKKGVDVFSNYWSGLKDATNPHVEPISTGKLASEAAFPDLAVGEADPLMSDLSPMGVGPFAGLREDSPMRRIAKGATEAGVDIATDPTTMALGAAGIENPAVNLGFRLQMGYGAGQHVARAAQKAQEKGWTSPETMEEVGKALPDIAAAYAPHGGESTDREVSSNLEKDVPNAEAAPTEKPEAKQMAVARTEKEIAPIAKDVEKWPEYKAAEGIVGQGINDAAVHVKNDIIPESNPSSGGHSEMMHGILGSRTESSGKIRINLVEHALATDSPEDFAHLARTTVEHELAHPERPHGDKQVGTDMAGNPYIMDSDGNIAIVPRSTKPGYAYEERAKFDPDEAAFVNALDAVKHHPGVVDVLNDMEDGLASSGLYERLRDSAVPDIYKTTPKSAEVHREAYEKGQMAETPPGKRPGLVADQLDLIEKEGGKDHPFFKQAFEAKPETKPDTTLEDFGHKPKVEAAETEPESIANFRKSQERKYGADWRLKQSAQEAQFYDKLQDDASKFVSLPGAKAAGEKPPEQYAFDKSVKQPNGDVWRHILQHDGTLRIERYDKAGNLYAAHEGPDLDSMEPVEIAPEDLRPPLSAVGSETGGAGAPPKPPEKPPSEGEGSPPDDEGDEGAKRIYKVRLTNGEYVRIKGISEEDAINKINKQLEDIDMTHVSAEAAQGLLTPLERAALGEPGFEQVTKDISGIQKKLDIAPADAAAKEFETHIKSQMDRVKLEEQLEAAQAREEYKKIQEEARAKAKGESAPAEKSTLRQVADIVSGSKRSVMSTGIPGTAISPHGFSIAGRQVLTANPLEAPGEAFDAIKAMISPKARDITKLYPPEQIAEMQSMGLLQNLEDYTAPKPEASGPWDNIKNIHKDMFERPLFGQGGYAQYVEAKIYTRRKAELLESGVSPEDAATAAAKDAKTAVGNVRMFAKDGTLNDLSRIVLFAPNWLASHGRIFGGMLNAILNPSDPRGKMYRNIMMNFAALTAGKEALSYALNGKSTFQNVMGHRTDVAVGKDSEGKDTYVRPEANSADAFRLPFDIADAIANDPKKIGEIVDSHMAPMTRAFAHLVQDRDHFGNPIYGSDKYGRPMDASRQVTNIVNELAQMTPSWLQAGVKGAEHLGGQKVKAPSGEEIAAKVVGLPISFASPPKGEIRHKRQTDF